MNFGIKLRNIVERNNSLLCIGLDSDIDRIPQHLKSDQYFQFAFNKAIVDATHDIVCAYKPNSAFYEAQGDQGLRVLARTVRYIKDNYPDVPIILDAKRGDIGSTNRGYVQAAFDELGVDAITVHPLLGREAMRPFIDQGDKGIIVLVRTSNPGAGEFQDLLVGREQEPLYRVIARNVAELWNQNGNCAVVVGATYPRELADVRAIVGDMPILIPGIGAQGGEVGATVTAGKDSRNMGMIINSSRNIIFASNDDGFAQAARVAAEQLRGEINRFR